MGFSLRIPRRSAAASCSRSLPSALTWQLIADMMEEIMGCGQRTLALHLKIAAWHEDIRRLGHCQGQCPRLALGDLKTILVPRQALLRRLFKPEVRVPDSWIAATPSLRKKCKSIKGTAGRRILRLIEERQCDEKSIDSKISFLKGSTPLPLPTRGQDPGTAAELRIPSPVRFKKKRRNVFRIGTYLRPKINIRIGEDVGIFQ